MIRPRRDRSRAVGWNAGPSDAEVDEAELRGTAAVVAPYYDFDTPPVEAVLQAETGQPDEAIPVRLTNPVNVNQLPTRLASLSSVAFADLVAHKIANEDPRRAAIRLYTTSSAVWAIGRTQAEADDANAYRLGTSSGPHTFHFTDEVWARRIGGAAGDRLSMSIEQWAN